MDNGDDYKQKFYLLGLKHKLLLQEHKLLLQENTSQKKALEGLHTIHNLVNKIKTVSRDEFVTISEIEKDTKNENCILQNFKYKGFLMEIRLFPKNLLNSRCFNQSPEECTKIHDLCKEKKYISLFIRFKKTVLSIIVHLCRNQQDAVILNIKALAYSIKGHTFVSDSKCSFMRLAYIQAANCVTHCIMKSEDITLGINGLDKQLLREANEGL